MKTKHSKLFLAVIAVSLMALLFASCGTNGADVDTSVDEIASAVTSALGDNYLDTDIDEEWLSDCYGIDMTQVDAYAAKENSISSINPDVMIILQVKDGYQESAVNVFDAVYSQAVDYQSQYPFAEAKVNGTRLYVVGNYVMYICAGSNHDDEENPDTAANSDADYEKVDEAIKEIFGSVPANQAAVG